MPTNDTLCPLCRKKRAWGNDYICWDCNERVEETRRIVAKHHAIALEKRMMQDFGNVQKEAAGAPAGSYAVRYSFVNKEATMKIGEYEVVVIDKGTVKVGCQVVTRDVISHVLNMMNAWTPPKPQFKVGDYVRVRDDVSNTANIEDARDFAGWYGRVVVRETPNGNVGVEFARSSGRGHSIGFPASVSWGHGYLFAPEMLEKVD